MRVLLYSQKKLEVSNTQLYWKLKVKYMQGKRINVERMINRKDIGNIDD